MILSASYAGAPGRFICEETTFSIGKVIQKRCKFGKLWINSSKMPNRIVVFLRVTTQLKANYSLLYFFSLQYN